VNKLEKAERRERMSLEVASKASQKSPKLLGQVFKTKIKQPTQF